MQIVTQGKYLGAYLGINGCEKTYTACEEKYLSRCFDLSLNVASALLTIVRYNERTITVFSYVSQVLMHPDIPRLKRLDHRGVHKSLKLPPNSMSQKLTHTFGEFCPMSPKPIHALCIAAHSRFAKVEEVAIRKIQGEALTVLGDNSSLAAFACSCIPSVRNGDKPLIESLLDSLYYRGIYLQHSLQLHSALMTKGRSPKWSQAWFYNIYACQELSQDIQFELGSKILITFDDYILAQVSFPNDWYKVLSSVLKECKPFVCMCIFKTYIGAWTTSSRMHEPIIRKCLLGCNDCQDNISHYMQCSPLWQIACEALGVTDPFNFNSRLCLESPTVGNAQLLALVFTLYHSAHSLFKGVDVLSPMPRVVQQNLVEAAKAFRHHING